MALAATVLPAYGGAATATTVPATGAVMIRGSRAEIGRAARQPVVQPAPACPPKEGAWLLSASRAAAVVRRSLDTLPGVMTWLIVLSPLWAGYLLPTPLAIAVFAFDAYWLYLSISTGIRSRSARRKLAMAASTDWRKLYRAARVFSRAHLDWDEVHHVVIIPNYRESEAILERTLDSLATQENANQIHVILAMEAREAAAPEKGDRLVSRFAGRLGGVHVTSHPAGLAGEVAGKSANEAWAARWARQGLIEERGWRLDATTVTSCDADTVFDAAYFSCLTYKFITNPQRYRRFWQSAVLLNNNIWETPAPLRVMSSLTGIHMLSNLMRRSRMMFPQSTYSLSFKMADDVGYWDADVIPEDWHMFLKCFYAFHGEVEVEPIFLRTGNDAVCAGSYVASLKMAYQQHKRHAWGSSDISYAIVQSSAHPEIDLRRRLRRLIALTGNHLVWSTHWFILSLGWFMPDVMVHILGQGHYPAWFPLGTRVLLWSCLLPYVSMFFVDRSFRPPKPSTWTKWLTVADVLWWVLLPVTSLIFSTLPALDAQTRLGLGKRLEYRVTTKST